MIYQSPYRLKRFGSTSDGGYIVATLPNLEAIIAYGVGGNTTFERDLSNHYKCPALCHDHTVNALPHSSEYTIHIKKGLACGHGTVAEHMSQYTGPVLLKIDTEGAEWLFLTEECIPENVVQIVLETHLHMGRVDLQGQAMANLLKDFVIVHQHANNCGKFVNYSPQATEYTLLRRSLVPNLVHSTTPLPIAGLDYPNTQTRPDIPIAPIVSTTGMALGDEIMASYVIKSLPYDVLVHTRRPDLYPDHNFSAVKGTISLFHGWAKDITKHPEVCYASSFTPPPFIVYTPFISTRSKVPNLIVLSISNHWGMPKPEQIDTFLLSLPKEKTVMVIGNSDIYIPRLPNVVDNTKESNLTELLHLISSAECFIGTDGGIGNLAMMTTTPCLMMYGYAPSDLRVPINRPYKLSLIITSCKEKGCHNKMIGQYSAPPAGHKALCTGLMMSRKFPCLNDVLAAQISEKYKELMS